MTERGRFITFEGGEGAGKSTQVGLLVEALRRAGLDARATREPGGTEAAEQIRALLVTGAPARWDPLSEALLHFAARREHLRDLVLPALAGGTWVVCDRFTDSTMAYQGYALGLGRDTVERLHALVVGDLMPDLTLVLDIPVETGLARAAQRPGGEDRYEGHDRAFHETLRAAFREIAAREPKRCAVIDASADVARVQERVRDTVAQRLGVALS